MTIDTWLVPLGDWQVRVHYLKTERELDCAEGGFSLANRPLPQTEMAASKSVLRTATDTSAIYCLSPQPRTGEQVLTPPNSNLLFAERAAVPLLRGELNVGTHLLISAVWAGDTDDFNEQSYPQAIISEGAVRLVMSHHQKHVLFLENPQ